jgi:hypothetical protein
VSESHRDSELPLTVPGCVYCEQRLALKNEAMQWNGAPPSLTCSAAAQTLGQEDDMTVLTLQLVPQSRIGEAHA